MGLEWSSTGDEAEVRLSVLLERFSRAIHRRLAVGCRAGMEQIAFTDLESRVARLERDCVAIEQAQDLVEEERAGVVPAGEGER